MSTIFNAIKICRIGGNDVFSFYFRLGIEDGADIIECDVCVTKDLQLVCRHESDLSNQTDVMTKPALRAKETTYYIADVHEQKNVTGVFTVDLTLEEVKSLRVKQKYDFRDPSHDFLYQIPTLQEFIDVAKSANRPVGIYPEVKDPGWVNSLDFMKKANTTLEDLILDVLHKNGYTKETDPCFVQTFSMDSLRYLSKRTKLPLIMLFWGDETVNDELMKELSSMCYGVGPWKNMILPITEENFLGPQTDLVELARRHGLKIHAYTFRNENKYLPFNYTQDPYNEYQKFSDIGIDGYFTDFPASLNRFLNPICPVNQAIRNRVISIGYIIVPVFTWLIIFFVSRQVVG